MQHCSVLNRLESRMRLAGSPNRTLLQQSNRERTRSTISDWNTAVGICRRMVRNAAGVEQRSVAKRSVEHDSASTDPVDVNHQGHEPLKTVSQWMSGLLLDQWWADDAGDEPLYTTPHELGLVVVEYLLSCSRLYIPRVVGQNFYRKRNFEFRPLRRAKQRYTVEYTIVNI